MEDRRKKLPIDQCPDLPLEERLPRHKQKTLQKKRKDWKGREEMPDYYDAITEGSDTED